MAGSSVLTLSSCIGIQLGVIFEEKERRRQISAIIMVLVTLGSDGIFREV